MSGSVSLVNGHIDPNTSRKKKGITVEHKGYILQQGSTCPHYMIFDAKTNEMVMHCSCTKYITEEEAKKHIEWFINTREGLE